MTSLIVKFPVAKVGTGGGVDARRAVRKALLEEMSEKSAEGGTEES